MRHTRNRQLNRKWKFPAIKIEDVYNDNALVCSDYLDKTFKWHREYNNVSYGNGDSQVFIDIYRDSVYW
ncbi:hypothetical protein COM25_23005 [Bacillus wiedmannii]|nr:hypothetical protein COM25_23005 [Bacillus wiedmannii]